MSEENKEAKVYGFEWRDPELLAIEEYPDNVDDTHCTIMRSEHKDVYLFCPKCKKVDPIPVCIDVDITHNHPGGVRVFTKGLNIVASCKECESDLIAVDRYMAKPVELLSNAGYGIVSCSQGNVTAIPGDREDVPEEEDYIIKIDTNPYIKFDKDYSDLDNLKLPNGWFSTKEKYSEGTEVRDENGKFKGYKYELKDARVIKYAIPDNMINYDMIEELDTDETILNMDGFSHFGSGTPCKELTKSIMEFIKVKEN